MQLLVMRFTDKRQRRKQPLLINVRITADFDHGLGGDDVQALVAHHNIGPALGVSGCADFIRLAAVVADQLYSAMWPWYSRAALERALSMMAFAKSPK